MAEIAVVESTLLISFDYDQLQGGMRCADGGGRCTIAGNDASATLAER
jgi:hypothetical protein